MEIKVIKSMNRRSLSLHLEPDGSIVVKAPTLVPNFAIKHFVKNNEAWIEKRRQELKARSITRKPNTYLYLGKQYELEIRANQKEIVEIEDKIYLGSTSKTHAKKYLLSWYKQQARKVISERVHHYAKISGVTFKSISLMEATTRWGSCSSAKSLNFNWKLIMAPLPVLDYVVTHEIAHLTEMNHSHDFWETVRKMYPLYREYRTWLKRHGHSLTI
jgi:predicted metal-dependent hydrolase